MKTVAASSWAILLCTCLAAAPALAQVAVPDNFPNITVSGTGVVRAKPNRVEMELRCTGSAELASDTLVKYRDTKRRILAAFESLKMKNLSIEEKGITLASGNPEQMQQMMMRGMAAPQGTKTQVEITRTFRLILSDIRDTPEEELMETIARLLDVSKDSGAGVGPTPEAATMAYRYGQPINATVATYVLDDLAETREQAYKMAVEDARARAKRLADLTGVKLGPVSSVQEVQVSGDDWTVQQPNYGYPQAAVAADSPKGPRIASNTFADLPIRVRLMVRFNIQKGE